MEILLGVVGFLGFLGSIIWIIINLVRKNSLKKPAVFLVVTLFMFSIGMATSSPGIEDNIISYNTAEEGGAIWVEDSSTLVLSDPDDNTYIGNKLDDIYRR